MNLKSTMLLGIILSVVSALSFGNYVSNRNVINKKSIGAYMDNRISETVFYEAASGMQSLLEKGIITNDSILAIADFSKPSNEKRLFIINICTQEIIFETLVAHGKNSGIGTTNFVSNKANSNMSSAGFFKTANMYNGKHGTSLKLEGLDKGFNDNALARGIVVHGADYVNESLAKSRGWIGRSLGCPAVPTKDIKKVIQLLPTGTCLFIYHPSYKGNQ